MKALFKFVIPAVVISGGALGIAMTQNGSVEPTRYEIIHTENGVTINHDTIVNNPSDYTIQDYIADLGLQNSEHLEVIKIDDIMEDMETFIMHSGSSVPLEKITKEKRVIIKHIEESNIKSGEGDESIEVKEIKIESDETLNPEEIRTQLSSQGLSDEVINQILGQIESGLNSEENGDHIDVEKHVEMKMFISDDSTHNMLNMDEMNDHIVYEKNEPNRNIKVAMIGDHNSTIAIVSKANGNNSKKSKAASSNVEMKFFPNPAQDFFTLNFENKTESKTKISIKNLQGKEVYTKDLGKTKNVNQRIETNNWVAGVYLIAIDAGKEKMVKKLIIK